MEQFKHFPHKWAPGANVIIKILRIFVRYFHWVLFVFFLLRPASPVTVEIASQRESA